MGACTRTASRVIPSVAFRSFLWTIIIQQALSLHVVPGSSCTALCSGQVISSNTTIQEITCHDKDYNSTDVGQKFKDCISCELQSETFDQSGQTDLGWAFCKSGRMTRIWLLSWTPLLTDKIAVNLRFTLSWCLFGFSGSSDYSSISPCSETCSHVSDALEMNIVNSSASTPYDYCDALNSESDLNSCASCYSQINPQFYLSNCKSKTWLF